MSIEKIREEYENWARAEGYINLKRNVDNSYTFTSANMAWVGWQASRESLVIELPPITRMESEGCDALLNCAHLIHAAGVKTK